MASYGNTVLTSAGIDLVKRVIANTAIFEITRLATSSDSGLTNATISTIEALTTLSSVQQTGKVAAFDTSNSKQVGLKCEFTNEGLTNQYDICAVGIYAKEAGKDEILFAVAPAKEPETMPAKPDDQSALFTFSLNMCVVVGQASAMTITATTEGVVKSINGTIKPDANGNVTMSYYSQVEVDQKVSSLSSMINSLNSTKASSADLEAVKSRVSAVESGKADKTSVADVNGQISTLQQKADSITSTLSSGGVNLLNNSEGNFQPKNGVINNWQTFDGATVYMKQVQKYTVSAQCGPDGFQLSSTHDASTESNRITLWLTDGNSMFQIISSDATDPSKGGTHFTWNHASGMYYLCVNSYRKDNSAYVHHVQIEYGDIATPWQPSNGDFSTLQQTANTAKAKAETNANSIQALSTQVNQNSSKLTDAANAIITLQHRADSITSTLSKGGVNLLVGTSSKEVTDTYPSLSYVIPVPADQTDYVLSFDAKSTVAGDKILCDMSAPQQVTKAVSSQNVTVTTADGCMPFNLTTDWVRYWVHYTITPTEQTPIVFVGRATTGRYATDVVSGTVSLKCAQLEYGEIATPWKPSNGDIINLQQTASKLQSDLTDTANAISNLGSKMPQAAYVPVTLEDKTDLNAMKTCGFFMIRGGTSNSPVDGWVYVKVLGTPDRLTQFAWQDINPPQQWCRWYNGSNWTPWTRYTQVF